MTTSQRSTLTPVALAVTGVSKTFGQLRALTDAELSVSQGEIHALLGTNGSGKSTLIKILAGVDHADEGRLTVGERDAALSEWSPEAARAAGLHFVHQDPGIFPGLNVMENLSLGRGFERGALGRISWRQARRRSAAVLDRFEIRAKPDTPVAQLRHAERTMLAIARVLQDEDEGSVDHLLVLDEPTASLPVHEVDFLLGALRRYAEAGGTIVFVSHRLGEVLSLADRVTVLRDGRTVAKADVGSLTEERLVELIVGRPLESYYPAPPSTEQVGRPLVELRGVSAGPLHDINLEAHAGEILGIAGLVGSGRTELLRLIFADLPMSAGEIVIDGQVTSYSSPAGAMASGVALVPEDRAAESLSPTMTVRENLSAAVIGSYRRHLRLSHGRERTDARRLIEDFDIRPAEDRVPVGRLSGGNAQKVVLARWLRRDPRLLLLDDPTQGVDVGARRAIYEHVRAAVERGMSAILVSSDFDELAHLADRFLVLRNGRIVAEARAPIDAERLTELCLSSTSDGSLR